MVTEIRKLTETEFRDLIKSSIDGQMLQKQYKDLYNKDLYDIFYNSLDWDGIFVDNLPIYVIAILNNPIGAVGETIIRNGAKEKYPFTMYKLAKKIITMMADKFGFIRCYMYNDESKEGNEVYRWVEKMGFKFEKFYKNRSIMLLTGMKGR